MRQHVEGVDATRFLDRGEESPPRRAPPRAGAADGGGLDEGAARRDEAAGRAPGTLPEGDCARNPAAAADMLSLLEAAGMSGPRGGAGDRLGSDPARMQRLLGRAWASGEAGRDDGAGEPGGGGGGGDGGAEDARRALALVGSSEVVRASLQLSSVCERHEVYSPERLDQLLAARLAPPPAPAPAAPPAAGAGAGATDGEIRGAMAVAVAVYLPKELDRPLLRPGGQEAFAAALVADLAEAARAAPARFRVVGVFQVRLARPPPSAALQSCSSAAL